MHFWSQILSKRALCKASESFNRRIQKTRRPGGNLENHEKIGSTKVQPGPIHDRNLKRVSKHASSAQSSRRTQSQPQSIKLSSLERGCLFSSAAGQLASARPFSVVSPLAVERPKASDSHTKTTARQGRMYDAQDGPCGKNDSILSITGCRNGRLGGQAQKQWPI